MWYFIIGLIVVIGIILLQAIGARDEFKQDIRTGEWWLALGYCLIAWPVLIVAFMLIASKKLI